MIEYPFHLSVKIMSRSKGHNTVAAAAYRAGTVLYEEPEILAPISKVFNKDLIRDKAIPVYNYSRRAGVMSSFIMSPKDAPSWTQDRGMLWNQVERAEKRVDAQLAREVVVSLPSVDIFNHLNAENKAHRLQAFYEKILRRYANDNFVKEGMIADIALHAPSEKNDERNYHAHIMLSMREVNADGFGKKDRGWNAPTKLDGWRQAWSNLINDTLASNKIKGFIDHRTYEARSLDIATTKPLGTEYHREEKRGVYTRVGNDNCKAKATNKAGHKYLEKVFEYSPMAPEHEILDAITKAGHEDALDVRDRLEKEGMLIRLKARGTDMDSGLWALSPLKSRADNMKSLADALYKRNHYAVPVNVVQGITSQRRDKAVREALNYTAQPQGFKVIEAENNGYKNTYLSSCHEMYKDAGYDVIAVARNNIGKDVFKRAGFNKGVLTYRDFLRRFGDRYAGAKSNDKKVILIDEADQLSPLQDQEIFKMAQKIDAKLIYIGSPKAQKKHLWQSLFPYYKLHTAFKRLKHSFFNTQNQSQKIETAFTNAHIHDALQIQNKNKAKYLHRSKSTSEAKKKMLKTWFKRMKRKKDNRFILTARDLDTEVFNFAIQKKRLEKKHLAAHQGKAFSVAYPSDHNTTLKRDMFVYWGDYIQFKKSYKDIGIEEGTRARVLIHYSNYSLLETDDGRLLKVNLKDYNGFDLGYAGRIVSNTDKNLEQGYLYHNKANALDDAPLLYQSSKRPVQLFYSDDITDGLKELANQLLGRRHDLHRGFYEEEEESDTSTSDNNDILTNEAENTPED